MTKVQIVCLTYKEAEALDAVRKAYNGKPLSVLQMREAILGVFSDKPKTRQLNNSEIAEYLNKFRRYGLIVEEKATCNLFSVNQTVEITALPPGKISRKRWSITVS